MVVVPVTLSRYHTVTTSLPDEIVAPVKAAAYVPPAPTAKGVPAKPGAATPGSTANAVSIYFASGQAALDTAAQRSLRTAAAAYVGIGTQIVVTGYADKTGNAAANVELAKKRAVAVRDELVKLGVESRRIRLAPPAEITGSGSDDQARRVDISVVS